MKIIDRVQLQNTFEIFICMSGSIDPLVVNFSSNLSEHFILYNDIEMVKFS